MRRHLEERPDRAETDSRRTTTTEGPDPRSAMQDEARQGLHRRCCANPRLSWPISGASRAPHSVTFPRTLAAPSSSCPAAPARPACRCASSTNCVPTARLPSYWLPSICFDRASAPGVPRWLASRRAGRPPPSRCAATRPPTRAPDRRGEGSDDVTRDTSHTHAVEISCKVASDADTVVEFLTKHAYRTGWR